MPLKVSGTIVDVLKRTMFQGTVEITGSRISRIVRHHTDKKSFIVPGFIDSHVHIESSMLVPSEFARMACVHGTVATVSDPHEIANVLGIPGVEYMIENGRSVPFKFYFGAPSCVPATPFETSGAEIGADAVETLLCREDIRYLSEMMNYPGVIMEDPSVMAKIAAAKKHDKPVDGHAPGLRGEELRKYIGAGISTDHETFSIEEAREKISLGMKIKIREGSAARNFDTLHSLISNSTGNCMLCSDDKHPDELIREHIDDLVRRAIKLRHDPLDVFACATLNPVRHYGLDVGLLQEGDSADLVVIDHLDTVRILKTFIGGELVSEEGKSLIPRIVPAAVNRFNVRRKKAGEFAVPASGGSVRCIDIIPDQIVTGASTVTLPVSEGCVQTDPGRDILKIAVVNRYREAPPATAFIRGFGIRRGAVASSVAHDSHNIVTVGVSDEFLARAVNLVIDEGGGLAAVDEAGESILPLPVAGIMSDSDGQTVANRYSAMDAHVREMGSSLSAPFMTLSFMSLVVIPSLKLSDRGLFDSTNFSFTNLFEPRGYGTDSNPDLTMKKALGIQ